VKRQVVLEDGEVVVDSGPLVTTNTTEDVEQQEHTTQEVCMSPFFFYFIPCFALSSPSPTRGVERDADRASYRQKTFTTALNEKRLREAVFATLRHVSIVH